MKRRFTRLGVLGLAVVAVSAVGASPASAKLKTATFNQCVSTFVPIPDRSAALDSPGVAAPVFVNVPKFNGKQQPGRVTVFSSVGVRITHTFAGDLHLILVSPGGKAIPLALSRGGSGDGFGTGLTSCAGSLVSFTDTSLLSIAAPGNTGNNPVVGTFRPEQPLSGFVGQNVRGFWTLVVTDDAGTDVGSINAVSLNFNYQYNGKSRKKKK